MGVGGKSLDVVLNAVNKMVLLKGRRTEDLQRERGLVRGTRVASGSDVRTSNNNGTASPLLHLVLRGDECKQCITAMPCSEFDLLLEAIVLSNDSDGLLNSEPKNKTRASEQTRFPLKICFRFNHGSKQHLGLHAGPESNLAASRRGGRTGHILEVHVVPPLLLS